MYENMPIEVISKFNTIGKITPIRLRIETGNHILLTTNISDILYAIENNYASMKTFDYGCKAKFEEKEHLFELRYFVTLHKWVIRKVLY